MRKEFEGVGKGGITEVCVNAMSLRGGREGNPVCYFFLARPDSLPVLSLLLQMPATQATNQGF